MTRLFPVWAIAGALLAWHQPLFFSGWKPAIVPLLAVIMFGMGLSLRISDFAKVIAKPTVIAFGSILQYTLMPLLAWTLALALQLETELMIGMILVGCSPGGTASNVICYLARGDVALSITLTAVSTLLSIIMTPLLCLLYLDTNIDVPAGKMFLSILQIVIAPVLLGLLINNFYHQRLQPLQPIFPLVSVFSIVAIIAIVVALNNERIADIGLILVLGVIAHNLLGLVGTYALSRRIGYDQRTSRTLAIEIAMQNSGLAVALALKFYTPLAALPGAVFSVWHNLSGAVLASWWSRK